MASADAALAVDRRPCHVVALPYPGRGHINAMLSLCRLLAARSAAISVTVVLTEEWLGLLGAPEPPPRVRFAAIPNVIPSEHGRAADFSGFIEAVHTKMEAPVERLLREMALPSPGTAAAPPAAVVVDMFLPWAVPMAARMGVVACSFCPLSATHCAAFYHFDRLAAAHRRTTGCAGDSSAVTDTNDQLWNQYIPGQTCIRLRDLEPIISHETNMARFMLRIRSVKAAQFVLFTSFYELEAGVMDSLMSVSPSPHMCPIGPCIPYMTLQEQTNISKVKDEYFTWLDSQPAGSVLYVSLGSFLSVSPSQLTELAMGLAASGVRFLWALRGELHSHVQQSLGDSNGILVPWCDQLKVLCHGSIGGFLTHCGMNSTLEAVYAGVPMLTFPIAMDQPTNSRLIVDVWKIGFSLKEKMRSDNLVGREEIAQAVKMLMHMDAAESKEVRRRALSLRETSLRAIEEGGSSSSNIGSFLNCILGWN
ncbi:hypothetical protein ACP4OV_019554 [Aristida adscensionis]